MPSVFTHAAVPIALRLACGRERIPAPLFAAGVVASMLPDLDVAAFAFGVPYADAFGHRGASHSLIFAALAATLATCAHRGLRSGPRRTWAWIFACTASHPLLDALTSGGLGVALLWPFAETRHFAPWRPIRVSPIGAGFFSARGLATLWSELCWVWLPLLAGAAACRGCRRAKAVET